jgi:hypothetical protein
MCPTVATSGPRSPPRSASAPSVAFGLGLRVLAAGPAHFLTVLRSRRLCERPANLINPDRGTYDAGAVLAADAGHQPRA